MAPRRMEREEYHRRLKAALLAAVDADGNPPQEIRTELDDLIGFRSDELLRDMVALPTICSRCDRPVAGRYHMDMCTPCFDLTRLEAIKEKVRGELVEQVRRELQQEAGR